MVEIFFSWLFPVIWASPSLLLFLTYGIDIDLMPLWLWLYAVHAFLTDRNWIEIWCGVDMRLTPLSVLVLGVPLSFMSALCWGRLVSLVPSQPLQFLVPVFPETFLPSGLMPHAKHSSLYAGHWQGLWLRPQFWHVRHLSMVWMFSMCNMQIFCSCSLPADRASYFCPSVSTSARGWPLGLLYRSFRRASMSSSSVNWHFWTSVLALVTKSSMLSSGFCLYCIRCNLCILKFTFNFSWLS